MGKPTEEELRAVESNTYVKRNKVDHLFVLRHFSLCSGFINEVLQSEGLTPDEFATLSRLSALKTKFESQMGHWVPILYALAHLRFFLKVKSNVTRFLVFLAYPTFAFDASYNFGRVFGSFLVMPHCFNRLLLNEDSIQALQVRLFLKRVVYEELTGKNNQEESPVLRQVFGKAFRAAGEAKDYFEKLFEYAKRK